jgi:hypothetical protein
MIFTDFHITVMTEQHEFVCYGRPGDSAVFGDIHASSVFMSSGLVCRVYLKAVRLSGFILLNFWKKAICMGLDLGSMREILYTKSRGNDTGCGFVSNSK